MTNISEYGRPAEYAKMDPNIKKKWLNELRYGPYEQGQQYLPAKSGSGEDAGQQKRSRQFLRANCQMD